MKRTAFQINIYMQRISSRRFILHRKWEIRPVNFSGYTHCFLLDNIISNVVHICISSRVHKRRQPRGRNTTNAKNVSFMLNLILFKFSMGLLLILLDDQYKCYIYLHLYLYPVLQK